jgi:acyl carrier protein
MTSSSSIEPIVGEMALAQTDTEKELANIWKEVIGVEKIGVNERFMDIGGNSLNLVEAIGQVKEKMGVTLKARLFFDKHRSTIAELSKEIDAIKAN